MRSLLFVSASDVTMLATAVEAGADGVCLDLESSVALAGKSDARKNVCAFIAAAKPRPSHPLIYVRINDLDTEFIDADLAAILPAGPDGVVLPRCANGQALQHLGARLAVAEAELGLADASTPIIAGVAGTAASIFDLGSFAGASQRLKGLVWSAEDVRAALRAETRPSPDGCYAAPCALARSLTLFAARAANVLAIDGVFPISGDAGAFRRDCEAARRDGFDAKMAIDPNQVAVVNAVFATPAEN